MGKDSAFAKDRRVAVMRIIDGFRDVAIEETGSAFRDPQRFLCGFTTFQMNKNGTNASAFYWFKDEKFARDGDAWTKKTAA